jgi:hypothetical protein
MRKFFGITLIFSVLIGFALVGTGLIAPQTANASTNNCVATLNRAGFYNCGANLTICTPSPNPCESVPLLGSPATCQAKTYTCPDSPGSGGTVRCDCNSNADCTGGQTCDEGTSASCTRAKSTDPTGLCKSTGGSDGGDDGGDAGGEKINLTIPGSIPTPLGDIPLDPTLFAQWLLNFGTGLGLLLSILVIIIGGYGVATSSGNPENLEKAKGQITAAITGLLFILLTAMILRTIGYIIGIDIKLFGI